MSSKYKRKGKAKFIMIERYFWRSEAWDSLSPVEQMGYLRIKWRYDGKNNGRIGCSCREMADELKCSKATASRVFKVLQERGFIEVVKPSGFSRKDRTSTEWRIAEYPCDVTGEIASKSFIRWRADEKTTVSSEGHTVSSGGQFGRMKVANHG
ncbi:helix-turn-helix domain-containing protein [Martelella limonii]|uniref:helix-turn-helix domain-containing protein n=1 Tax=Martelella limonii TaxID=1647649 RepID=UPI00157FCBFD|nr:helix-turn-helix domain-containing protein [Martelella limonii]